MIVTVLELIKARRIKEGQEYVIRNTRLCIIPALVFPLIEQYLKNTQPDSPLTSRAAIREALKQAMGPDNSGMVLDTDRNVKFGGGEVRHTIVFNLDRVQELLDIPLGVWQGETVANGSEL